MKKLIINLLTTFMVGIAMLCVLAMVPFAFALSFINSLHQGNNE